LNIKSCIPALAYCLMILTQRFIWK